MEVPEQSKGSVYPSGPRWPWRQQPWMPLGRKSTSRGPPSRTVPQLRRRLLGPWTRGPGRAGPPPPTPANQAAKEVLLFRGLSVPSSLPALLQLKSWVREESDVEAGGTGCLDTTEGTLQREMQNNRENMPEVTSRAQGTKKESGRNRRNSEKPRRKPISWPAPPSNIAYIVK